MILSVLGIFETIVHNLKSPDMTTFPKEKE